MKRRIVLIAVCIAVLISPLYFFIPNSIVIHKSVYIENNLKGLRRALSDSANWHKWWPGNLKGGGKGFLLNGNTYSLADNTLSSVFVTVSSDYLDTKTSLNVLPGNADSIKVEWMASIPTSYNPVKRLHAYLAASGFSNDVSTILGAVKSYYSTTANLYDLDIQRDIVKNSSFVSTYDSSKGYPSTEKIYSLIDRLRKYIASQHAVAADSPMLNIYTKDSVYYLTKVALPTDKKLVSSGNIEYRWMLGGGNILTTVIKGEPKKVDSAFAIVETYVQDYELMAPAIPYYSLETNRLAEKDSTKWVTKIYYPIMYFK